jgi:hypothetical protein
MIVLVKNKNAAERERHIQYFEGFRDRVKHGY